ncbi:transcriptional regulator, TetR family protein [Stappia aggregata IAM 12614]|uniref:Transcriptional regulator, TetR family protein n=1 Tax=Roseibium aggregatum (strain ATCC 25650 / DSM 13394 / JCM 20685 / NBRC 16684 / NCIMB 2208 / IAM 12614 / B1) TaxID=384765 RepID=A0P4B6_ROSAI|nr:TetR/AcrR family transcriptional regulator [Roseibium aggregatum]EAV40119.1 transcriptional regulator, TetR family protein [Stappia aggregata IAM 12614] [Roseibium aggregatum IAM 12614]
MPSSNRQSSKTKAAIQSAFAELVFTRRYSELRMTDVARAADIGRSTLYLHYPNIDAILLENMAPLLNALAGPAGSSDATDRIEEVLRHIWSHRDRGRVVLFGVTGQKLERALAQQITEILPENEWKVAPVFIANQGAAAVFAILRTWLSGEASCDAKELACHIHASLKALVDETH